MNIDKLKQVIQEANPDRNWIKEYDGHHNIIRLADCILALRKLEPEIFQKALLDLIIGFDFDGKGNILFWNLKDNSLDNQSDETKKFLIELLT